MNKYTGVLGIYNCQGAAWNSVARKNTFHQTQSNAITGFIRGRDVHVISEAACDPDWAGDCVIYCHHSGDLIRLPHNIVLPVTLKVLEHELYTVTPVKVLAPRFDFAPLGLIDMYNAGGAIEGLIYEVKGGSRLLELGNGYGGEGLSVENLSQETVGLVRMEVKGCGRFGAYSSVKPRRCTVGSVDCDFVYDSSSGLVSLNLDYMPEEGQTVHIIEVEV